MKNPKKMLISAIALLMCILNIGAFAINTVPDNKEINWYYVYRKDEGLCEVPKESKEFLESLGGYYVGDKQNKVLYLTFDEGYERGNTPAILDTLKKCDVKAAFFVVKPYIDTKPEIIQRMVDEGHLVCNHSSHHHSMASFSDVEKFKAEFTEVEEAFTKVTGKEMPKYFRPPMGKYSKFSLEQTKALGYKTVFWSFAYKDWLVNQQPGQKEGILKIKSKVFPGCIILLHAVSDTNTKILEQVLTELKNEGWEFRTLDDLK